MHDAPAMCENQRLTDIPALARLVGVSPEETRLACRMLLTRLASPNADLGIALVQASAASGAEPGQIITMLQLLASDFGRPLETDQRRKVERMRVVGDKVCDRTESRSAKPKGRTREAGSRAARSNAHTGLTMGKRVTETADETIRQVRTPVRKD
ncbi:MAG: hypothetical protein H6917_00880 [Novosphingobium sp.]|nr:hypothetical protein [Novosphingobium sp.]MCP5400923.1 hypothetical protein [Novosphingobium sp.]